MQTLVRVLGSMDTEKRRKESRRIGNITRHTRQHEKTDPVRRAHTYIVHGWHKGT